MTLNNKGVIVAGFRTVVISKNCKLESKLNFLVIRSDIEQRIFINEIENLIIESTSVALTSALIADLIAEGVNIVFCNNKHLPVGSILPLHNNYESARRIHEQINWPEERKKLLWQFIVKEKIKQQAEIVKKINDQQAYDQLIKLYDQVLPFDFSNNEAVAARLYFSAIFGSKFSRDYPCNENAVLNYGYSILMSFIAREISAMGYVSELGIWHCSNTNPFNLACDFMEPFRPIVDNKVIHIIRDYDQETFQKVFKREIVKIFNDKIIVNDEEQFLGSGMRNYLRRGIKFLNGSCDSIFDFKLIDSEDDGLTL